MASNGRNNKLIILRSNHKKKGASKMEFHTNAPSSSSNILRWNPSDEEIKCICRSITYSLANENPSCANSVILFLGDNVREAGFAITDSVVLRLSDTVEVCKTLASKTEYKSNVFVLEAPKYEYGFAVWSGFFENNKLTKCGDPLGYGSTTFKGIDALGVLIRTLSNDILKVDENATAANNITLCGFSKGGVVLNEILTESAQACTDTPISTVAAYATVTAAFCRNPTKKQQEVSGNIGTARYTKDLKKTSDRQKGVLKIISKIKELHFLDSGLNCRGAYITDPRVAEGLRPSCREKAGLQNIQIRLHGTPRQWKDIRRNWLAGEKNRCFALLKGAGLDITEKLYLENDELSLGMHFRILEEFNLYFT